MHKATDTDPENQETDDMRAEYSFDYGRAQPSRFAGRAEKGRAVVAVDPDVSAVFTTPESVNAVLRALITTMPTLRPGAIREMGPCTNEEEQAWPDRAARHDDSVMAACVFRTGPACLSPFSIAFGPGTRCRLCARKGHSRSS